MNHEKSKDHALIKQEQTLKSVCSSFIDAKEKGSNIEKRLIISFVRGIMNSL